MINLNHYSTIVSNCKVMMMGRTFVGRTSSLNANNISKLNWVLSNNKVHYQIKGNMKENVQESYEHLFIMISPSYLQSNFY